MENRENHNTCLKCRELEHKIQSDSEALYQISAEIYELSKLVINSGKSKSWKLFLLAQRFRRSPVRAVRDLFAKLFYNRPIAESAFPEIEQAVWRLGCHVQELRNGSAHTRAALCDRLKEGKYRGIWIIGSQGLGWNDTFKQRHHHLAENLMANGYLVFCAMNPAFAEDVTDYIKREDDNLYLVNFQDRSKRMDIISTLSELSTAPLYYTLLATDPGTTVEDIRYMQSLGVTVFYDYCDELSKDIYPGVTPMHFERHDFLLKNSDVLICATAENLYKKASKYRSERVLLSRNGVCLEDWECPQNAPVPPEMQPVLERGGRIIGFYGNFAPWLDYDMFITLAKKRPDYNLVMIGHDYEFGKGAFAKSGLQNMKNVFIIPAQKYKNLKYFSRFFDVGVVPFRIYELTISVSPVKMFEYMAQGIPPVTSAMPECKMYKSCLIADDPEMFVRQVDRALELKNDPEYQAVLAKEAAENTWSAVSKRSMEFVEKYGIVSNRFDGPLLSIAVPCYNVQEFLLDFFNSITALKSLSDLEIILVNDASKDGTLELARKYEERYPGIIKVIDKENGGHGSCINAGLRAATGKYFKLVDGDDFLDPEALEEHLEFLKRSSYDMVVCDYLQFYSDGSTNTVSWRDRLLPGGYEPEELQRRLHTDHSMRAYIHMHAVTYKSELLKKNNIVITENSFYVDQEYISLPWKHVRSIAYQPIELYRYRLGRPGQSVDPAVIRKRIDMNFAILQNLQKNYAAAAGEPEHVRKYLLEIIFHHSYFFLTYAEDAGKINSVMQWWNAHPEGREQEMILNNDFSRRIRAAKPGFCGAVKKLFQTGRC